MRIPGPRVHKECCDEHEVPTDVLRHTCISSWPTTGPPPGRVSTHKLHGRSGLNVTLCSMDGFGSSIPWSSIRIMSGSREGTNFVTCVTWGSCFPQKESDQSRKRQIIHKRYLSLNLQAPLPRPWGSQRKREEFRYMMHCIDRKCKHTHTHPT